MLSLAPAEPHLRLLAHQIAHNVEIARVKRRKLLDLLLGTEEETDRLEIVINRELADNLIVALRKHVLRHNRRTLGCDHKPQPPLPASPRYLLNLLYRVLRLRNELIRLLDNQEIGLALIGCHLVKLVSHLRDPRNHINLGDVVDNGAALGNGSLKNVADIDLLDIKVHGDVAGSGIPAFRTYPPDIVELLLKRVILPLGIDEAEPDIVPAHLLA